jgi:hypothetical protein
MLPVLLIVNAGCYGNTHTVLTGCLFGLHDGRFRPRGQMSAETVFAVFLTWGALRRVEDGYFNR